MANQIDAVSFASTSIGKDLRKRREAAGLQQIDVARRAHIRPETLSRIEHGHGNPTVRFIRGILRAIEYLKSRHGGMRP